MISLKALVVMVTLAIRLNFWGNHGISLILFK